MDTTPQTLTRISEPLNLSEETGAPPVPRGYTIHIGNLGQEEVIFCQAPKDNRKQQARVPAVPKRWFLMEDDNGVKHWMPENDFPTRPIREFMIAQGLRTWIKFGIAPTHKAPKPSTILRMEYGMKGKPEDLLEQFLAFRKITLKEH